MTGETCHAEVRELQTIFIGDQNIGGLYIAMDNRATMGDCKSSGDVSGIFASGRKRQAAFRDNFFERLAFDQLHNHIRSLRGFFNTHVVNGDDARVREFADHACFAKKAMASVATGKCGREKLDGDGTIDEWIVTANDAAMGTDAECFVDLVAADLHV
jgi:hypothetical protein